MASQALVVTVESVVCLVKMAEQAAADLQVG
jgi:hypothetical protein